MTFDEWMRTVNPLHKPTDDGMETRLLRQCWDATRADELRGEIARLHAAVCQAVALLNRAPEVARCNEARQAHTILREVLALHADWYMNEPVTEGERAAVAAKHQRKPRTTTAAEMKQQAKSDTSCVGAFARARPGKA